MRPPCKSCMRCAHQPASSTLPARSNVLDAHFKPPSHLTTPVRLPERGAFAQVYSRVPPAPALRSAESNCAVADSWVVAPFFSTNL